MNIDLLCEQSSLHDLSLHNVMQAGKGEGVELDVPTREAKFAEPSDSPQSTAFR